MSSLAIGPRRQKVRVGLSSARASTARTLALCGLLVCLLVILAACSDPGLDAGAPEPSDPAANLAANTASSQPAQSAQSTPDEKSGASTAASEGATAARQERLQTPPLTDWQPTYAYPNAAATNSGTATRLLEYMLPKPATGDSPRAVSDEYPQDWLRLEAIPHPGGSSARQEAPGAPEPLLQLIAADAQLRCPKLQVHHTWSGREYGNAAAVALFVCQSASSGRGNVMLVKVIVGDAATYVVARERRTSRALDSVPNETPSTDEVGQWALFQRQVVACQTASASELCPPPTTAQPAASKPSADDMSAVEPPRIAPASP